MSRSPVHDRARPPAESGTAAPQGVPLPFRIVTWIAIIDQLVGTQANRLLRPVGLPLPQFVLLTHFSFHPARAQTVTAIASALQQEQPATTKTIQKLVAAGLLREMPNPADGRSKLIAITPAGLARHRSAVAALEPDLARAFSGWKPAELRRFLADLDRLKIWFDANR